MERNLVGASPHSVAIWLCLEIHERKPDGNLTGMPIKQKKFNGIIHCDSSETAEQAFQILVDKVQKGIEDAKSSLI